MIEAIVDTHALIWYLFNDARLSVLARTTIEQAAANSNQIGISTISLTEIIYLQEKARIPSNTLSRLQTALDDTTSVLVEVVFDRSIATAMQQVDRAQVPELADRIIAATAFHLDVPVVTRDQKIQASTLTTIW
jgi:PIN domain nuclease of toxin-antitoxin system